ncbi:BirA family transcriptional regulator, biotin operon repressor / biotin-[acetyl-CoA-carboxylase] ligase [Polynucleobacter meluiroseus]|uniref:biotin--[biotin carboxyl-carrier protein] ligase n=1 Tax=Polynucleobacter meluiroseus TaxID=1938814 RepID=A0A240DX66_9BURK|nr:biotin--[acetyl-CoA-carboxylase] ligase [Polynucleobacter meluiroseus]SNX27785.1 BirA family transcriptional regulator, biotin operon repressor / biotin-[acetyl-CoA-carboxylase] ligase [Polynucleobacter meluiroseus]
MNWNCTFERVAETASTNDDLLNRWRAGELTHPVARIAYKQTAGKGRAGRTWLANPQDSLCFSLAYPYPGSPNELSGLSLCVGLALISGLASALDCSEASLFSQGLRLKWPNDLLLNHAKLGGVLIEGRQTNMNEPTWMIIGVGMNLRNAAALEAKLDGRTHLQVGSLDQLISEKSVLPEIDQIWLKLISALENVLTQFEKTGFSHFRAEWQHWDAFYGQPVRISAGLQPPLLGLEQGVDDNGALLLERDGNLMTIFAGDVSLRAQE